MQKKLSTQPRNRISFIADQINAHEQFDGWEKVGENFALMIDDRDVPRLSKVYNTPASK